MHSERKDNQGEKGNGAIAVVGIACLFPGSTDVTSFWKNILAKKDMITEIPQSHWLIDDHYDPDPRALEKTYARKAGTVPEVPFDYKEFGIPPNTLSQTDSSQLLGLLVTKALLTDVFDVDVSEVDREKVGVILGFSLSTILSTEVQMAQSKPIWVRSMRECGISEDKIEEIFKHRVKYHPDFSENTFPGLLQNVIAGRISNRFDFHGTNCVVDAACASSLSAVHLAIKELNSGDSDLVITGGVQTISNPAPFFCFSRTPALSFSGTCRPFDERADGIMLGEGVGFIALKRLQDAERDGNKIYAVIRGIGTSSDGKGKSIYAPETAGQQRALVRAYAKAGYGPETVELMEAHGTGTLAGDLAELHTLQNVISKNRKKDKQWCALGSIKSQIGHTLGAAGSAGLIKTIMALHHKVLPPTINVTQPTSKLDFKRSALYLNTETRPWIHSQDFPRRAAVSAFGFGGTNFHVTLEEYRGQAKRPPRRDPYPSELILFSGKSVEDILTQCENALNEWEAGNSLFSIARESQKNFNPQDPHRLSIVASSGGDFKAKIPQIKQGLKDNPEKLWLPPVGIYYSPNFKPDKVAFLFPGQGSQYLNMGADLVMNFDKARELWDRIDGIEFERGTRLSEVVFPIPTFNETDAEDNQERLTSTQWAQPALGATSAAMISLLDQLGLKADMVAGHSFGEETSLYYAGAYDLDTFMKLSRKRGELMAQASHIPGGMAAVSGSATPIQSLLDEMATEVIIANQNSPKQTVISGPKADLAEVQKKLELAGLKVTPLKVATAFHSSLVSPSSRDFYQYLKKLEIQTPEIPVYSNQTAKVYPSDPEEIRKAMAEQIANPVRFENEIKAMQQEGANLFIEVGPGSTLSGLVKDCLNGEAYQAIHLDIPKKNGVTGFLNAVAQLSALGVSLNFDAMGDRELPLRDRVEKTPTTVMVNSANYDKKYPLTDEDPAVQARSRDPLILGKGSSVNGINKLLSLLEKKKKAQSGPVQESQQQAMAVGAEAFHKEPEGKTKENSATPVTPYHLQSMPPPPPQEYQPEPEQNPAKAPVQNVSASKEPLASIAPEEALGKLENLLIEIISETTGYPKEILARDMNLEADLGIDSIKRVEIFMSIKERVPNCPDVQVDQLAELQSIGQIVEFMNKTVGDLAASGALPTQNLVEEAEEAEPTSPSVSSAAASTSLAEGVVAVNPEGEPSPAPGAETKMPGGGDQAFNQLDKLKELLLEIISTTTGYPRDILTPEMQLEADLGIDSIKRVEIFMTVNEKVPNLPEVSIEELANLQSIGQILDFMHRMAGEIEVSEKVPAAVAPQPRIETPPAAPKVPQKEEKVLREAPPSALNKVSEIKPKHAEKIKRVEIRPRKIEDYIPKTFNPVGEVVLFKDELGVAEALQKILEKASVPVRLVSQASEIETDWQGGSVIYLSGLKPLQHFYSGTKLNKNAFQAAKKWVQGIDRSGRTDGVCFVTVQNLGGDFGFSQGTRITSLRGGLAGLSKTLAKEYPEAYVKAIDIDMEGRSIESSAQELYREIFDGLDAIEVGISNQNTRQVLQGVECKPGEKKSSPIHEDSVLVVSGGARGVTAACVIELAKQYHPKIVLFGRSKVLDEEPEFIRNLQEEREIKQALMEQYKKEGRSFTPMELETEFRMIQNSREVRKTILALQEAGSPVKYYSVDILESRLIRSEGPSWTWKAGSLVRAALAEVRQEWGPITGLIHGAGVIQDKLIKDKDPKQFDLVFDTKVSGLEELLSALEGDPLEAIVLFSSVSARYGNPGQCDYAMANEVMNKIAQSEKRIRGSKCVVKSINWGPWDGGLIPMALRKLMSQEGIPLISLEKGSNAFVQELVQGSPEAVEVILLGTNGEPKSLIEKMEIKPSLREEESLLGRVKVSIDDKGQKIAHSSRVFDPSVDTWLRDHCPTYLIPTMPFTLMLGMMEEAAHSLASNHKITGFKDVKVTNWLSFAEGFQEVRTYAELLTHKNGNPFVKVTLKRFRKAGKPNLSRFEPFCTGLVLLGQEFEKSQMKPQFENLKVESVLQGKKLYEDGFRFHGPVFEIIQSMHLHPDFRMTTFLDNTHGKEKSEIFRKGFLLDGAAQSVPHEESLEWMAKNHGMIGFPYSVREAKFYGPLPENPRLRCEVEFKGYGDNPRLPRFEIRVYSGEGEEAELWARFLWEEVLVSLKGLENISPRDKKRFLNQEAPLSQLFFARSSYSDEVTISLADVKSFDWLAGTVARIYLNRQELDEYRALPSEEKLAWLTVRVGAKELIGLELGVHPSFISLQEKGQGQLWVSSARRPINITPLKFEFNGTAFRIKKDGPEFLNVDNIYNYWNQYLHQENSPVAKMSHAIGKKFLREMVFEDPRGLQSLEGRPCLYLANHQTFIESFLFGAVISGLAKTPLIVLGKKEHENAWPGKLSSLLEESMKGEPLTKLQMVDREDVRGMLENFQKFQEDFLKDPKSLLVHVEGRRAFNANQPVEKLSSLLIDLSLKTGIPIVPVRIRGGLPLKDEGRKYDFPVGFGSQSFWVGKVIKPESLNGLPLSQRAEIIKEAINDLGGAGTEFPNPPDSDFEDKVQAWREFSGCEEAAAIIFQALVRDLGPSQLNVDQDIQEVPDLLQGLLLAGLLGQKMKKVIALVLPDSPEGQWVKKLAQWVYGTGGPKVFLGKTPQGDFASIVKAGITRLTV